MVLGQTTKKKYFFFYQIYLCEYADLHLFRKTFLQDILNVSVGMCLSECGLSECVSVWSNFITFEIAVV